MYIKFVGSPGSGKTALVRQLTTDLTGIPCDYWNPHETPIPYVTCNCKTYTTLGKWKPQNRCCGVDSISGEGSFVERVRQLLPTLDSKFVFDEGMINTTHTTVNAINSITDLTLVFLDYSPEICYNRIINLRYGSTTPKYIEGKVRGFRNLYDKFQGQKMRIVADFTLPELSHFVIERLDPKPCNCMSNIKIPKQSTLFGSEQ